MQHQIPFKAKHVTVAIAFTAIFAAGYWARDYWVINEAKAKVEPTKLKTTTSNISDFADFSSIVVNQGPAVVNISVRGSKQSNPFQGFDPNDPFFEFFKRFQPPMPQSERPITGTGSGFIVKSDGVILTNAHVVDSADDVTVRLTNQREYKAKIIGVDKPTDVAVLKIDANNLPTVKLGSAKSTKVGDWVVAIGSPYGLENTVTAGIISAKSRALPDEGYVPFLQTDVAINPGNSGGPLFNLKGEVIGINSQIFSRSGGYQGLSFAIPVDIAMQVEQQLLENGKVTRGRLGVMIQSMNQELASSFGLETPTGALVSSVDPNSAANEAGIETGDVILKFDGHTITRSNDLPPLVAATKPGQKVDIDVLRDQKVITLSASVGEMHTADESPTDFSSEENGKLGLSLRPLTNQEQKQAKVANGLIVVSVTEGAAAGAGIQVGDILLAVNGEKLNGIEALSRILKENRKRIALLIQRDNRTLYIPIKLDK